MISPAPSRRSIACPPISRPCRRSRIHSRCCASGTIASASRTRRSSSPSAPWNHSGHSPTRTTLVHGDFRMGNLMMDSGGLTGVLDWELAHVGDPIEDLGWLCVPAWRFLRPDRPAAGLGTPRGAARRLRATRRNRRRPGGPALVGAGRHAALGGDLRDAGVHAPVRRDALGRARRHRSPGVRGRVGPARAARPAAGGRRPGESTCRRSGPSRPPRCTIARRCSSSSTRRGRRSATTCSRTLRGDRPFSCG